MPAGKESQQLVYRRLRQPFFRDGQSIRIGGTPPAQQLALLYETQVSVKRARRGFSAITSSVTCLTPAS